MECFGFDLGREGVNFAKGTWRAMDFNRFPKEREGEDEDKGNECGGGVGFGGFAKISAIVELKETFFFSFLLHFFTKKMHRQSD